MSSHKERREELKGLSNGAQKLVSDGAFDSVNLFLLEMYMESGEHKEFKTFYQWKAEGKKIIKGSRAFAIWGKPIPKKNNIDKQEQGEDAEMKDKYFPICYLFSNAQVQEENL